MVHQSYMHLVLQVLTAVIVIPYKCMWSSEWLYIPLLDDYWCGYLLDGTSTLRASGATKYSLQSSYRLQVRVIRVNDCISLHVMIIDVATY